MIKEYININSTPNNTKQLIQNGGGTKFITFSIGIPTITFWEISTIKYLYNMEYEKRIRCLENYRVRTISNDIMIY